MRKRSVSIAAGLTAGLALGAAACAEPKPAPPGPGWVRPPPAEGHSYPDCFCVNRGLRVELGRTSCLRVGGEEFTARCGMSLNNPAWRRVKKGCDPSPSAGISRIGAAG